MTVTPISRPPGGRPRRSVAPAPEHLDAEERALWAELSASYQLDDPAARSLLGTAMEARMRGRRCRQQIDAEGEVYRDRWNQPRPHPLLIHERDARAGFIAAMKALSLDVVGDGK